MKTQVYAKTKQDLHDLCETLADPTFQPRRSKPIPIFPSNIVRMALQDFNSESRNNPKHGADLLRSLRGNDPGGLLDLARTKSSKHIPKANIPYRMRKSEEHAFMANCAAFCGMTIVDALSMIVNFTIDRLATDCTSSDWERLQKMNINTVGNKLRGGFRSKNNPIHDNDPDTARLRSMVPSGLQE